jgi:hypothetical protein
MARSLTGPTSQYRGYNTRILAGPGNPGRPWERDSLPDPNGSAWMPPREGVMDRFSDLSIAPVQQKPFQGSRLPER